MCNAMYQYWSVTLHYYPMGLVAKDISENQEVKLFILVLISYLEPIWGKKTNKYNVITLAQYVIFQMHKIRYHNF